MRICYGLIFILTIFSALHALTFNFNVGQQAQVDIAIYLQPPATTTYNLMQNGIVRYSLFVDPYGKVLWWQSFYDQSIIDIPSMNSFVVECIIRAEDHIKAPILLASPFAIDLTAQTITDLAQTAVTQVYVTIQQRTYQYLKAFNAINFFSYALLKADFVGTDVPLL